MLNCQRYQGQQKAISIRMHLAEHTCHRHAAPGHCSTSAIPSVLANTIVIHKEMLIFPMKQQQEKNHA